MTQSAPVLPDVKPITDLHAVPIPEIYKRLEARPDGLTEAEVKERQTRFGRNRILKIKGKPLVLKLLANFTHLMALLLWIGGVVGFIAKMPQLGLAIWTVNLINGAFSFWQEYKAEKATKALLRLLPPYARVLRDGIEQSVLAEELVPGDMMLLAEGDRISADGRMVEAAELRVVALKGGVNLDAELSRIPRLRELPFDSHRKRMSTVHQGPEGTSIAYVKGSPKEILELSTYIQINGQIAPLAEDLRTQIVTVNGEYAHTGLRLRKRASWTVHPAPEKHRCSTDLS